MIKKYLTFDCYGTLINTEPLYQWIENLATAAGLDSATVRETYANYEDDPANVQPYLDYSLLVRADLKHLDQIFAQGHFFESHYVECLQVQRNLLPYPDVVPMLTEWHKQGYQLIIMSNSSWDIMPANLAALQLPFDAVITAEDVQAYKPDLKFFKYVEQRFNLTKENHWHIARGYESDVVPADAMQWPMLWINRNQQQPTTSAEPTHMVADLAAAKQWIN
ncbi:HAD family hydrolase [Lactiplantibacillus herbarum]|uniref:HAD family hydrolase n=1 Tax=Lactiplantibacillus herbarum TaxID=1670446 RepID=UPI00064FF622|nr:HAD family hydrolase [Lactiplantibacillus herbarum]